MITIGYSTREHNPKYIEYLKKSSGYKKIEVIEKINNGEKSLSQVYNEILEESKTDIVVLCHDDIYFETTGWFHKIESHFKKSDYGILGVAGTTHMTETGRWWDLRKKMIGIVNHESGGKKWTSKYSEEFGNNIRITHKSIGQTNEKWEENRELFVKKYGENLPIKSNFDPNRRIKVLLSCLFFRGFTGSELYVYELAKSLMKLNCSVTVLSQIGGPLTDMAKKIGIKCLSFEESPGFKLGDGVWGFETPNGHQVSILNNLYKVSETDYDIVHIQHKPVAERILNMYPELDKIYSIHSEVISLEDPVKDPSIKKYIAIRPEIKSHMIDKFQIPEEMIDVIYNPIDNEKFKSTDIPSEDYVLFVGTIDYLRKESILDLMEYTREISKELWLVGENNGNYLDNILLEPHVKHFSSTWNIENYISKSFETAGVQLGRTTIESWMCGKPSWIYKVDSEGFILSKERFNPPSDIEKYFTMNVAQQIKNEYIKIL
jgi:hypothetical protein